MHGKVGHATLVINGERVSGSFCYLSKRTGINSQVLGRWHKEGKLEERYQWYTEATKLLDNEKDTNNPDEFRIFRDEFGLNWCILYKGVAYRSRDYELLAKKINCPVSTLVSFTKYGDKYAIEDLEKLDFEIEFNGKVLKGVLGFEEEFKGVARPHLIQDLRNDGPLVTAKLLELSRNPVNYRGRIIDGPRALRILCKQSRGVVADYLQTHSVYETAEHFAGDVIEGKYVYMPVKFPFNDGETTYNNLDELGSKYCITGATMKDYIREHGSIEKAVEYCNQYYSSQVYRFGDDFIMTKYTPVGVKFNYKGVVYLGYKELAKYLNCLEVTIINWVNSFLAGKATEEDFRKFDFIVTIGDIEVHGLNGLKQYYNVSWFAIRKCLNSYSLAVTLKFLELTAKPVWFNNVSIKRPSEFFKYIRADKAEVVSYLETHSIEETLRHFKGIDGETEEINVLAIINDIEYTSIYSISTSLYLDAKEVKEALLTCSTPEEAGNKLLRMQKAYDFVMTEADYADYVQQYQDSAQEHISEFNRERFSLGDRAFANFTEIRKFLGCPTKSFVYTNKKLNRLHKDLILNRTLEDALKEHFGLCKIGLNKSNEFIAQYTCPKCGETLVISASQIETLKHSKEFCNKYKV